MPHIEHKKSIFPNVQPTAEAADEINKKKEIIDTDLVDLRNKLNKVNEVATEQKNKGI